VTYENTPTKVKNNAAPMAAGTLSGALRSWAATAARPRSSRGGAGASGSMRRITTVPAIEMPAIIPRPQRQLDTPLTRPTPTRPTIPPATSAAM
jgi:hypothetical protein